MIKPTNAKLVLLPVASLLLIAVTARAEGVAQQSCSDIRARIGIAPQAEPELLRALASRKDCGFTSAEVYQAAYGDRPLPPQEERKEWLRQYHHLDGHHIERD